MLPSKGRYEVWSLITRIGILKMLVNDNLLKLRNTQLAIGRYVLPLTLCIENPTNALSSERQVILVLLPDSEVFLNLLNKEPSEELRGSTYMLRSSTRRLIIPTVFRRLPRLPCAGSTKCTSS